MLVLIGGGEVGKGETLDADLRILQMAVRPRPRMLLLPPGTADQGTYGLKLEDYWQRLGADAEAVLLKRPGDVNEELERRLSSSDILYLGGGSLSWYDGLFPGSPLLRIVARFAWHPRKILVGISAGALMMNPPGMASYRGWGLLAPGTAIEVHAQRAGRLEHALAWSREHPRARAFALRDGAAVFLQGAKRLHSIGHITTIQSGKAISHEYD